MNCVGLRHITTESLFLTLSWIVTSHYVRLAYSVSCSNYERLCQQKLLPGSSSLFDWQTLWGYCYFEHTVSFLRWRYQIAYSPNTFRLLPFSSPCSERKGLQW